MRKLLPGDLIQHPFVSSTWDGVSLHDEESIEALFVIAVEAFYMHVLICDGCESYQVQKIKSYVIDAILDDKGTIVIRGTA